MKKYYESEEGIKTKKRIAETKSKKVYQYTKDGEFVKEWCSLREIGRVLGFDTGHISSCCKGKRKSAYKFIWRFKVDCQ